MADARRKKAIVFNKDDLRRGADDIRREFGNIKSSGKSSARGVQEAFESLGKRAKTALNEAFDGNSFKGLKDVEESLKIQRKAVDDLTEQYKKAKAEFDSVNLGTQDESLIAKREKASHLYRQVSAELKGEEELLKKQEEAFKLISTELQTAGDKSVTFYTQMRQIREEMNKLALAGKDQTPEYDNLRSKLDEVSVAYRKVQQEQQMLAKYGNMLIPGLIQGMSGLAGAFSVYQGVSSLFIKDNEKLAEVQTKLQSAMALTIGLQQVQQTLHSTSAFRIGVVRKATQAWTTAQNALNTSLGISKGLAGAFMTGGIMALVAGVGYLITKYKDWNKEQEKLKEAAKSYLDSMTAEIVESNRLFEVLRNTTAESKEYARVKQEISDKYGEYLSNQEEEVRNLRDVDKAQKAVTKSIVEMARAKGMSEKIEETTREFADKWNKALSEMASVFVKQLGEEEGAKVFREFSQGLLLSGGELTDSLREIYDQFNGITIQQAGAGTFKEVEYNPLAHKVEEARIAFDDYNQKINRTKTIFGDLGSETKNYTGLIEEQKHKLDELNKKYGDISKIDNEEVIASYNKEKKAIEDEISRLESLGVEKGGGTANRDNTVSLIEDIEKTKLEIAKQGIDDRLELLKIEEEYELDSLNKRLENAKYSEEEKQNLILLIQKLYSLKREQITEEEQQKRQAEIEKSLEAYTSYEVQRNQIIEKYAKLRENAKGNKNIDTSLIDKEESDSLSKLDKDFGKSVEVVNTVLDLTRATTKQLVVELENVREKLKNVNDAKEAESLQNRIENIVGKLETKAPFVAFKENLKEATKDGKVDFELLGGAIDGLLPELQGIADDSRALFGDGAGDFMDGLTEAIGGVADLATSIGAFASGDIAGGIAGLLSAGNKFFGNARKVNAEHREALRLLKLQREQLEHQYKTQELLKKLEDNKSIFGSDAWGQSRRSAEVYATSIKDLEGSIRKLQDVEVVTGSRKSGWGPWKKRKDVWTPILEAYPKLIKSSGEFDRTLAENILSTQKLSDEGKFALQSAIDNADALEQAYTQMSDNLSAVFGNLGATIMDTFSEAFKSGKDGFADMFDSAGDMLEQLTKQMIYSVTLQPIMEEASKQMMDIQSSSKSDTAKLNTMMEIIGNTINDAKKQEDRVNLLLGYAKEQANKQGLNILNDSEKQQSSVGVTKTASQDSIDVLDGRLTHVQETNQEISNNSNAILEQMRTSFTTLNEQMETSRNITLQSMYHLADISKNTNELYAMNKTLQRIDNNTKGI